MLEEVQVTELVRSWVLLSENVPVALSCIVAPALSEAFVGVTVIAVSAAPVTDNVTLPVREPEEAWIVALPTPAAVAKPVGLIETIAGLEDVQVAAVNISVLPFASFPVAEKSTVFPFGIVPGEGETEIDTSPEMVEGEPGDMAQPARSSGVMPNRISPFLTNEAFIILSPVTIFACTELRATGNTPLCYRQFRVHIRLLLLRLVERRHGSSRRGKALFRTLHINLRILFSFSVRRQIFSRRF